ncbi:hypothetical protein ACIBF6_10310 [Streptosporangium amethystogenes]|uniref:hypothetical protein n=1 Tax=Streptosporangium amethystogenes TaxID=2002 RepID=UPI003797F775
MPAADARVQAGDLQQVDDQVLQAFHTVQEHLARRRPVGLLRVQERFAGLAVVGGSFTQRETTQVGDQSLGVFP